MADVKHVTVKTVRVQPGDTLWKIAQRELGNGRYYLNLFLMNATDLVASGHRFESSKIGPDFLWPGQELKIINGIEFDPSGFTPSGQ